MDAPGTAHPVAFQASSRSRRAFEAVAFVGTWIAAGSLLRIDADAYLLLGIPLTGAFQRYVRRAPISALWLRDGRPFSLDRRGRVIAVSLALLPLLLLIVRLRGPWTMTAWLLACIAAAVPAAFAIRHANLGTLRELALCLVTAGSVGCAVFIIPFLANGTAHSEPAGIRVARGIESFLLYLVVGFVLEEVVFRGLLDSHVHHDGERLGIASAVFVSALWGLWHIPIAGSDPLVGRTLGLLLVHTVIGIPLSIFWRRSGNLLVPAFTHAFVDGVRNALV